MKLESFEIAKIVNLLNDEYFLPTIQREFVWLEKNECKIEKLFDSIMQGYPIGNMIAWPKKADENGEMDIEVYEFLDEYVSGQENNNRVAQNICNKNKIKLVIDGQQRLTAFKIGLSGVKKTADKELHLYLNLFSNIENDVDNNDYNLQYEFKFKTQAQAQTIDKNNYWLRVGSVVACGNEESTDYGSNKVLGISKELQAMGNSELAQYFEEKLKDKVTRLLGKLHWKMCKEPNVHIFLLEDADEEMVLNVFVRTNDGGVKLEKADLLLSFMEANKNIFQDDEDCKGARKQITNFVNALNKETQDKPPYNIAKDDILKACLVLTGLEPRYNLKNFNHTNLCLISNKWADIKRAYGNTINLIASYGFKKENVTSKNALIPIAYYLLKNNLKQSYIDSQAPVDLDDKKKIISWFITALLGRAFGASSDTTLKNVRKHLDLHNSFDALTCEYEIKEERLNSLIKSEGYGSRHSHLLLMLFTDEKYWGKTQVDHIFPESKFKDDYLKNLGYDDKQIKMYREKMHSIANLQLLSPSVNNSKNDDNALEWFNRQSEEFKHNALIPDMPLEWDNFLEFINKREKMILEKLAQKISVKTLQGAQ